MKTIAFRSSLQSCHSSQWLHRSDILYILSQKKRMGGMVNMPELTPEEVTRLTEEWETYCRLAREGIDRSNTLFPEYNSSPIGKNIYTADDFTWKATRLVKGGLAPKGKICVVIQVIGKCRAGTLLPSESTHEERRVVAYRLREQVRIDKGV